jgi:hypothetical protein
MRALQVFISARISFHSYGASCTHDAGPLHPYIPSPPFA